MDPLKESNIQNKEEPKLATSSKDLVDQFFNFTLTRESCKKYAKPALNLQPIEKPAEPPKIAKLKYKGTDYAEQYQHELFVNNKTPSLHCSTMVSGPTDITHGTFVEKEDLDDCETVIFGSIRTQIFRKSLPIYKHRREIMKSIQENPVTLIQGSTGCGKSTQVPQYIYDDCAKKQNPCNIIISQPRKIAAVTIAYRVAQERSLTIGQEVGYQVGLDKCAGETPEEATQITYCTTGVVLQKLIAAKSMTAYTHVILDEVHERSIETDLLIAIIRRFLRQNSPNTKIVLMSATMDIEKFKEFFKSPFEDEFFYPPVIDLTTDERNHSIVEYFVDDISPIIKTKFEFALKDAKPEIKPLMYQATTQLIASIIAQHRANSKYYATILVFLPGINEIEILKRNLEERLSEAVNSKKFEIFTLHSMLSTADQKKAFVIIDGAKIVLSTNIAESSITIANVTHVIDFCLRKRLATDGVNRLQTLVCDWATQNNCKQRAGRTGRVCRGSVYRLVKRAFYNTMKPHPEPEIKELSLESVILKIKKLDMGSPCEILGVSLDPPNYENIVDAVLKLKEYGGLMRVAMDNSFEYDDGEITFLGEVMAALPCDARISKLIVMGYVFSVLDESIIIGAGLSIQGIFKASLNNKMNDYKLKMKWADDSQSDLIAVLNAYSTWMNMKNDNFFANIEQNEKVWCENNGLDWKNLNEMRLWIEEVKNRLKFFKIENLPKGNQPIWNRREKIFALKVAFAAAFGIGNFGLPAIDNTCERDAFNIINSLNPKNTVYFRNMPLTLVGRVYEKQIIDALVNEGVCDNPENISISFDLLQSERVIVSFKTDEDDDNGGRIAQEVYNAVKLRRLKNGISIKVKSREETLELALAHDLVTVNDAKVYEKQDVMEYPELCALPTCFENELKGNITNSITCQKFYFRPHVSNGHNFEKPSHRHNKAFLELKELIKNVKLHEVKHTKDIKEGEMVLVKYKGENTRGIVLKRFNDIFLKVNLMDIGLDIEVETSEIYTFSNDDNKSKLQNYPPRVILCRLQEIKPAFIKGFDEKWSEDAINKFKCETKDKKVLVKVFSVYNDTVNVKLYVPDTNGNDICWNDKLVADGYATECEETFASKHDHADRERRRNLSADRVFGPEEEFKGKLVTRKTTRAPPISINFQGIKREVRLKGPVSPLEIPLKAIVKHISTYVAIEGGSVNQILLNDNFKDLRPSLCVAAEMYLDNELNKIKLRETTIYPNIVGLPVLFALMFAPTLQVYRNSDKTRYTSILAGLGADDNNVPYFADRDAMLDIDFELSQSDFFTINNLRYTISKLLYVEPFINMTIPNLGDGQRENLLRKIKDLLMKILRQKRIPREIEEAHKDFEWNVDQEDVQKMAQNNRHILEFISCPPLVEMDLDKKKKLFDHAIDLEHGGHKTGRINNQECKLCNVYWGNREELKIHLLSMLHKNRKEQLIKSMEDPLNP